MDNHNINLLITVSIVILIVFGIAGFWGKHMSEDSCDSFKSYPLKDVPARCFEYFKINQK